MFAVVAVVLVWNAMHQADIPDTAPHFRVPGHSIIKNPEPAANWALYPAPGAIVQDTHRHAQRGDVWPER